MPGRKPIRRTEVLTRMKALDGVTLAFTFPTIGRRKTCEFVRLEDVPPFEGDSATFELERTKEGSPWPRWVAVRRVD